MWHVVTAFYKPGQTFVLGKVRIDESSFSYSILVLHNNVSDEKGMWTQEFILLYLTNRAKSPRSLTSSTKSTYNRLSQSPSLLVSGSRSSLSLCQRKHKKFLARSLRLRNILSLTWEQVLDLLHSSLLITVGNKGNTLWFCFESNW